MDNQWKDLKIIKDFFQVGEDGQMPEGSRNEKNLDRDRTLSQWGHSLTTACISSWRGMFTC